MPARIAVNRDRIAVVTGAEIRVAVMETFRNDSEGEVLYISLDIMA